MPAVERDNRSRGGAAVVGAGILLSRCVGLLRERVFASYFGNSAAADAFKAALRIPNILQNLFGEGALSASFIPVYSRLRSTGDLERARLVSSNILALLVLTTAVLSLTGVLTAGTLVDVLAPGFAAEKRDLAVELTRIFFPSVFLLVCSAWCLGVLNSHRRFFLPYVSPVIWNLTIIVGLLWCAAGRSQESLAVAAGWAAVAGSALQCAVQLPLVWKLLGGIRFRLRPMAEESWDVVGNFGPVLLSRGVVQISAYTDSVIASFLPTGAVAAIAYAQNIALLPISLFSMSISAAELPGMSEVGTGSSDATEMLKDKLLSGLRRIAFFVVPSSVCLIVLGDVIVRLLYETGRFTADDTQTVWRILAVSGTGLLCSALARLTAATFYALQDTRTPFRCSLVRVLSSIALGICGALFIPRWLGVSPEWGILGLSGASAIAGAVEYLMLRNRLQLRIGVTRIGVRYQLELWFAAIIGAVAIRLTVMQPGREYLGRVGGGAVTLGLFGFTYLGLLLLAQNATAVHLWRSALRRCRRES